MNQSYCGEILRKDAPMEITYTQVGDYLLPDIVLREPPDAETLNRYGIARKKLLKQHRPIFYCRLLLSEELYPHCREVGKQAQERLGTLMEHFIATNAPLDKAKDSLAWASHTAMLKTVAEEIIIASQHHSLSNSQLLTE